MKLAGLVAQRPLPAGSGVNLASAPPSGIASGLQDLAQAGTHVANALAAAEAEKRKYQQALDGSRAVSDALDQLDQAETTLKIGQRDPATGEVLQAPAAHDAYMPAWLKARDEITQQALERAPDAESKMVVGKLLEAPFRERQHAARKFSNDLYIGQLVTGVEDEIFGDGTGGGLAQRAATDNTLTPSGAPLWETRAMSLLASMRGAIPEEKLRTLREKFTTQVDVTRVQTLAKADPQGAIDALKAGQYRLPPDRALALADSIGKEWERRDNQQAAAEKRAQVEIDKQQTEAYHAHSSDLYADAVTGTATLDDLEAWRRQWRGRPIDQEYIRIRKAILEPEPKVKEFKSDPAVRARVIANVEQSVPSIRRDELVRLNEAGQLDSADLKYALGRIRESADHQRSLGESAEGRARTEADKRHQQAEQEMRLAIVGPDSMFKDINPVQDRLLGQAMRQLRVRSNAYGGKEDPLNALDAMLPDVLKEAGRQTQMRANEARTNLAYPSRAELDAARAAGRITEPYYREQQDRFKVIEGAEKELQRLGAGGDDDAAKALEKLRGGAKGAKPAPAKPSKPASSRGGGVEPNP